MWRLGASACGCRVSVVWCGVRRVSGQRSSAGGGADIAEPSVQQCVHPVSVVCGNPEPLGPEVTILSLRPGTFSRAALQRPKAGAPRHRDREVGKGVVSRGVGDRETSSVELRARDARARSSLHALARGANLGRRGLHTRGCAIPALFIVLRPCEEDRWRQCAKNRLS